MKVTYRIGLKMPIDGVQFSNNEGAMEVEVDGATVKELVENIKELNESGIDEVAVELGKKIDDFVTQKVTEVGGKIKNTIQELNTRLEKAREMFLSKKKGEL